MKRVIAGVVAAGFLLVSGLSYAADMVYVDLFEAFNQYQKTIDFDKDLAAKQTAKESDLQKKKEVIDKMREELALLKDEAKKKKEDDIAAKASELQAEYKDALTALKQERDEKMKSILEDIEKTIDTYAKANKLPLVLKKAALAFGDPALDRTKDIISTLNKNYQGKASAPAPKK
jgi:Skp family chaperone for outer membrane proteins